jgi:hypothetical protein
VKLDGSLASVWGSTPKERRMRFPCDRYLSGIDGEYFRATAVGAPPAVLFRWLCQLKVAPYSYDLIDNFGHRSPKELTPGVENLARGQKLMSIFELVDFQRDRHLTVTMSDPRAISIFGHVALSYVVLPISDDSCRLVAKMRVRYPRRAPWSWMRWFLPWGDLLMMRKQFLTLKHLAETGSSDRAILD